jgi:hypothetical protein
MQCCGYPPLVAGRGAQEQRSFVLCTSSLLLSEKYLNTYVSNEAGAIRPTVQTGTCRCQKFEMRCKFLAKSEIQHHVAPAE